MQIERGSRSKNDWGHHAHAYAARVFHHPGVIYTDRDELRTT